MAEYIDREAAIKSICHEKCRTEYGECQKGKHDDKIILCVCDFLRFLPAVSVPQWISIKDRVPEDNDRVIAFRQYEAEVSAYRYCVMWGWALKTSVSHSGITHWMPLPEPPKGEQR